MTAVRVPQVLVAVAAAALLVVSIGGFVGRDTGDDAGGSRAGGSQAAGAVSIVDFAFDPPELTTTVGDAVTWTNEDGATHTVTSDGDGPLDSGDLDQGATYDATFEQPGTYAYICTIHPTMQGTVEVTG